MSIDIIHTLTNLTSYNRGLFAGLIGLATSIGLPACSSFDGKVVSNQSGELVSIDERQGEAIKATRELQDRYDAEAAIIAAAQANIDAITRNAVRIEENLELDLELAAAELEARNELLGGLGELITEYAPAAASPWLSWGLGAVAAGLAFDNRRKDGKLKTLKAAASD